MNSMANSHTTRKRYVLYTIISEYVHSESLGNVESIEQGKAMKLL